LLQLRRLLRLMTFLPKRTVVRPSAPPVPMLSLNET
jgi:hypothetical protein